jgi:hypothetical protein
VHVSARLFPQCAATLAMFGMFFVFVFLFFVFGCLFGMFFLAGASFAPLIPWQAPASAYSSAPSSPHRLSNLSGVSARRLGRLLVF